MYYIYTYSISTIHSTDTFGNQNQCFQGNIMGHSYSLKALKQQKEVVGSCILWAQT